MGIFIGSEKGRNRVMHQTSNFGGSTLESNGLNKNEGVINYTQLMASRQASIENVIKFILSPTFFVCTVFDEEIDYNLITHQ